MSTQRPTPASKFSFTKRLMSTSQLGHGAEGRYCACRCPVLGRCPTQTAETQMPRKKYLRPPQQTMVHRRLLPLNPFTGNGIMMPLENDILTLYYSIAIYRGVVSYQRLYLKVWCGCWSISIDCRGFVVWQCVTRDSFTGLIWISDLRFELLDDACTSPLVVAGKS